MIRIGDVQVDSPVWLAPMTGVSDLPFRKTAAKLGARYVATEMVASKLLASGRRDVVRRAAIDDFAQLKVVQLVGASGAGWRRALGWRRRRARRRRPELRLPGQGGHGRASGSALMRDLDKAVDLIAARWTHFAARDVKMRLGWDDAARNAPELAARAEAAGARAFTVHWTHAPAILRRSGRTGRPVRAVKAAVSVPVIVNGTSSSSASAGWRCPSRGRTGS
jgi:tRNA-dihydrouridine synthase